MEQTQLPNATKTIQTTVCIIGAGPAGATAALHLDKMGIKSVLIDRAVFPRHKVCGEAMRVNVYFALRDLDPEYLSELEQQKRVQSSRKVRLVARNGTDLTVNLGRAFSIMGKRYVFDDFLIQKIKAKPNIELIENQTISKIEKTENGYLLHNAAGSFVVETKLVLLAAGGQNNLLQQLHRTETRIENKILGVRAYFQNTNFPDDTTHIFFFEALKGGYLWAFPLPNGAANVGLAVKAETVQQQGLNLRALLETCVKSESLSPFLGAAEVEGKVGGATLSLPELGQPLSGAGYMLVGDSGLSINPITGLGVGHAMKMGRYAANQVQRCLTANDFGAGQMQHYDREVYGLLRQEVEGGLWLTGLLKKTWLVNGLIRFFGSSQRFRRLFDDPNLADNLKNGRFLLRKILLKSS